MTAFVPFHTDHSRQRQRAAHMAAIRASIHAQPAHTLSAQEAGDLQHMREEEKIARDVYLKLGERWPLRPFMHIPGSEQAHMDAIALLLAHHRLPDPVEGLPVGVFREPAFQSLYRDLVQTGLRSEVDAIRVGLLIEELDIADLAQARTRTRQAAILAVYKDLERGSRNHLRAFFRHLEQHGASYEPQHLDRDEFMAIAHSEHESC